MASDISICNQVRGASLCASTNGTLARRGNPSGSGQYCWCRMTAPRVGAWVFAYNYSLTSYSNCSESCASGGCAGNLRADADFRAAVLGP
jgi:hypothetical protein